MNLIKYLWFLWPSTPYDYGNNPQCGMDFIKILILLVANQMCMKEYTTLTLNNHNLVWNQEKYKWSNLSLLEWSSCKFPNDKLADMPALDADDPDCGPIDLDFW